MRPRTNAFAHAAQWPPAAAAIPPTFEPSAHPHRIEPSCRSVRLASSLPAEPCDASIKIAVVGRTSASNRPLSGTTEGARMR
jgi:hypothetical protein